MKLHRPGRRFRRAGWSTAHRDRGIKLDLYARSGVRQYWIVDPDEDVVDVWRFGNEPGHERFSGEFSVRLGAERLGRIDLDQVFSRHLDVWGAGEGFPFATCAEFAWVALGLTTRTVPAFGGRGEGHGKIRRADALKLVPRLWTWRLLPG